MLTWPAGPDDNQPPAAVAVVGAGFVGRGLVHRLVRTADLGPPLIVNRDTDRARRAFADAGVAAKHVEVTDDPGRLSAAVAERRPAVASDADVLPDVDGLDVIVEATGAMEHGTRVMLAALSGGRDVVSMNAEVDALLGHVLSDKARRHHAVYSIADGDQPGVLLRMIDEAVSLGLEPAVALNCKRNLYIHQSPEDSRPYAERDGTSVAMTTAFGDGTKMQIENVVTANLSRLRPAPVGTPGIRTELENVAQDVARAGLPDGCVHFTLGGDFGGGVLVLARSADPDFDAPYLRYSKLGDGPLYPLFRPYHLIHMEVPTTIRQVRSTRTPLGRRSTRPVAACVTVAKQDLAAGTRLDGIGGAACYGLAAADGDANGLLPIGLAGHATLRRAVARDAFVRFDDVELDDGAYLVRVHAEGGLLAAATGDPAGHLSPEVT